MPAYKHILVPTDGSKLSLKAAREAVALASNLKAKITAVYVIEPWFPPLGEDNSTMYSLGAAQEEYRKTTGKTAGTALAKVTALARAAKVGCEELQVIHTRPWQGIIETARKRKCDLIIMGSRGRGGLAGVLLGSETHKVLTHSKIPVLVCR